MNKINDIIQRKFLPLLMVFLSIFHVEADTLNLDGCYMPWEYGDGKKATLIVRPIGSQCHLICQNQCKEFAQTNMSSSIGLTGVFLNQDIVDNCLRKCQGGSKFSHKYRVEDKSNKNILGWKWSSDTISTNTACGVGEDKGNDLSESYKYHYAGTDFVVKSGDKIKISLSSGIGGNIVYGCGVETKRITPAKFYPSTDLKNNDGTSQWNVDSRGLFDTGIKFQPGDFIKVGYGGLFSTNYLTANSELEYPPNFNDYNLIIGGQCEGKNYFPGGELTTCFSVNKKSYCIGKNAQLINCEKNACDRLYQDYGKNYTFCNLQGRRSTIIRDRLDVNGESRPNFVMNQFIFSGYLSADSKINADSNLTVGYSRSNLGFDYGAYEVEVTRMGCPLFQGEGLQYAVVPVVKDSNDNQYYYPSRATWKNVRDDGGKLNGIFDINVESEGRVYLRIDPARITGPAYDTAGGYSVIVNKVEQIVDGTKGGFISDIINNIRIYFMGGKDSNGSMVKGQVERTFRMFVADSEFITMIRALLVLFCAYTGISYMIGIAQITQVDALTRIIKFAFVVILISPNSWDFFNYYLFSFFLQGAMELVYDFAQPIADVNTVDVSNLSLTELTNAVFAIYNKSFTQIFNPTIWTKIWALACTNLVGFPLALIIAISLVSYVICIIRAIVIYIISLITLFILFLIFPILLCFVLFKKTADIFQSVIGNMLSMMLQPVFVFVAIAFLHEIFLQALYAALSFTACPTCLLSLSLKDRYICIPPKIWWVSLFGAHYPMEAGVGSPVSLILPVICVLILAQCMDGLVGLMSRLAERIATASFYGFNLGHAGATAQSIVGKQMTSFAGAVLNVDLASGNSKQGRQAALDNKTSQNNKGQTSSSKDASSAAKRSQGKTDGKNGS